MLDILKQRNKTDFKEGDLVWAQMGEKSIREAILVRKLLFYCVINVDGREVGTFSWTLYERFEGESLKSLKTKKHK